MDQEQRQRRQALLAVHDEPLPSFMADDDGAKEVVPVALDLVARMPGLVGVQELPRQVVDQLADLPFLPGVLALVEVDGVLGLVEHLPNGVCPPVDGLGLGFCCGHAGNPSGAENRHVR